MIVAPDARSGRSTLASADSGPMYWPSARTVGCEPPVASVRIDISALGASGAKSCHASMAVAAWEKGQDAKKYAALRTGVTFSVRLVTMPNWPPPPPRRAQNRSGSWLASTVRSRPSAVTTVSATTLSQVRPSWRLARP